MGEQDQDFGWAGIHERLVKIFEGSKGAAHSIVPAVQSKGAAEIVKELSPVLKKALGTKAQIPGALEACQLLHFVPALHFELYGIYLYLFPDSKLGKKAIEVATKVLMEMPKGEGKALTVFLPILLAGIANPAGGKWKIRVGCLEILEKTISKMDEECPHQMAFDLPELVADIRLCVNDARADVKGKANKILHIIGNMVTCPEVRAVSDKLITCLSDSANMKAAAEMLNLLANTTFLHHVDAASFALLFPIVSRAMKETSQEAQQKGVMIMGACSLLIQEPRVTLTPYLPILLPLIKTLVSEPQANLQREAAKCMGTLALSLPCLREADLIPYLLNLLQSKERSPELSSNDRAGAALSLSEITIQVPEYLQDFLPEMGERVLAKTQPTYPERRAGALTYLGVLAKQDATTQFLPYIWPWILKGLIDESELVRDAGSTAGENIVHELGAAKADYLIPHMIDAVFTFGDANDGRDRVMKLIHQLCDKLGEMRKFGQDLMSMEVLTDDNRLRLCCFILIARTDSQPAVRRLASLLWKEGIQSGQKSKRALLPTLMLVLKDLQESPLATKQNAAQRCIADLIANKEMEADEADKAEKGKSILVSFEWDNLKDGSSLKGRVADNNDGGESKIGKKHETIGWDQLEGLVREEFARPQVQSKLGDWSTAEGKKFLEAIVVSVALEAKTANQATDAVIKEVKDESLRGLIQALYDVVFLDYANGDGRGSKVTNDENLICRVENLMLMYGGGNLLLKNTTLELRKAHRYGVVGRNGAGKTTLMNLLATGGVAKMPDNVKVIHVHHEIIHEAGEVESLQFMKNRNPNNSKKEIEDALVSVQFPREMWSIRVGELSGGWAMRLLLASTMVEGADVLLLDEPTNHLDVKAIAWLGDYCNNLDQAAIMVISHDPNFLNMACTDIIQYSQEKLVYHEGNFDDFKKKMGLGAAEADALLQGNASDVLAGDTYDEGNGNGNGNNENNEDNGPNADAKGEVERKEEADRKAKITFPTPGKVQGVLSASKPLMELKNITFGYTSKKVVLNEVSCKLGINSRVAILGVNGAGKSTMLNLLCQELHPAISAFGEQGQVVRHRNCRLAFLAQQHAFHLAEFMKSPPYVYMQKRFQNGWDEALQRRLMDPKNEEEAKDRVQRAKKHGKYGNEVETLVGRQLRGNDLYYEVKWKNLDDLKQNSWESMATLKNLGVESFALALDARMQAQAAQLDQRPLTQKEIVKHLEQFGLTEEMVLNRNIGMFSAGQRSKMTLGAAMWIKPHIIALDEPTNYIDMETLDSLALALNRFRGGVVAISHSKEFIMKVCTEQWWLEDGNLTVSNVIDGFERMSDEH